MIIFLLILVGVAAFGMIYFYGMVRYLEDEMTDGLRKRETDAKIIASLRGIVDTKELRLASVTRELEDIRAQYSPTPEFLKLKAV